METIRAEGRRGVYESPGGGGGGGGGGDGKTQQNVVKHIALPLGATASGGYTHKFGSCE